MSKKKLVIVRYWVRTAPPVPTFKQHYSQPFNPINEIKFWVKQFNEQMALPEMKYRLTSYKRRKPTRK